MLSYKNIKDERQWKSTVGLTEKGFHYLSEKFGETFEEIEGISIFDKAENLKKEFIFKTYEETLFFILFSLRNSLVFDTLGFIFGIDSGLAQKNLKKNLPILEKTLSKNGLLPKREFKDTEEFSQYLSEQKEIIIDVTEYSIQRPENNIVQKEMYSGKKKRHTVKNLVISGKDKSILFLGKLFSGSKHDYTILQKEFPPKENWFDKLIVRLDLGFQGFKDIYKTLETVIPFKKRRKKKGEISVLTQEEKQYNKVAGGQRIKVEHSIGGMKRYRILIEKIRLKKITTIETISSICAGLWNFSIKINAILQNNENQIIITI